MSTDAHVVSPLFFPGGDIGCLSVHGTINDVAMMGARPLYLAASFILEEGFALAELARIVASMAEASREAGVLIVTGDTKVVESGKGDDHVFITTTALGALPAGCDIGGANARVGDVVIISGSIGDHGMAILSQRESLAFETEIVSDTAALHTLVAQLLEAVPTVRVLRDPTRGGLASTLNEIATQSGVGISLEEAAPPIELQVAAACELLGLDPLNVANEGKMVVICDAADAYAALAQAGCAPTNCCDLAGAARPVATRAARIGEVIEDGSHFIAGPHRFRRASPYGRLALPVSNYQGSAEPRGPAHLKRGRKRANDSHDDTMAEPNASGRGFHPGQQAPTEGNLRNRNSKDQRPWTPAFAGATNRVRNAVPELANGTTNPPAMAKPSRQRSPSAAPRSCRTRPGNCRVDV